MSTAEGVVSANCASVTVTLGDFSSTFCPLILACCGVMIAILAVMGDAGTVAMDIAPRKPDISGFVLTCFLEPLRAFQVTPGNGCIFAPLILLRITKLNTDYCLVMSDVALVLVDVDVVPVNVAIFCTNFSVVMTDHSIVFAHLANSIGLRKSGDAYNG